MASTAWAAFPEKPIRWIVGFPPGGATDSLARVLGQPFSIRIGQPVVVENKPGAGARWPPRPWRSHHQMATRVMGADNSAIVINPLVYKNLQYDPDRDFRPVGLYAFINLLLVVKADSPIRTAAEFLETSRTAKDPVPYASPGIGTPLHLAMERLAVASNIKLNHIAYKGMAPALQDVLGGSVNTIVIDYGVAAPSLKTGRLRALATFSATRLAALPDVPTLAEQGLSGFSAGAFQGLIAPRKTPDETIGRLTDALAFALADPEVKKRYADLGVVQPPNSDPQTMAKVWEADKAELQPLIRNLGIKLDA